MGFYGTDIGDFNGQVTVALTDIDDQVTTTTVPNTIRGQDGSLLIWGFIDTSNRYKSISFGNTNTADNDLFGFDDLTIAGTGVVADPEPATLALLALGVAGLGFSRRRKQ